MPPNEERLAEVRAALDAVTDPELDQSVVDLGFITEMEVDGDRVAVAFRLPTYWCSAGFAWIMAEDMRAALTRLPWVASAEVRLVDHFAAGRIHTFIPVAQWQRRGGEGHFVARLGLDPRADTRLLPVFVISHGAHADAGRIKLDKLSWRETVHGELSKRQPFNRLDIDLCALGIGRFVAELMPRSRSKHDGLFSRVVDENTGAEWRA